MQTQLVVHPFLLPPLPSLPRALCHYPSVLDNALPTAQPGPGYPPTPHVLPDRVPRDASSSHSISVPSPSQPTRHFPPSHPRPASPPSAADYSPHSPSPSPRQSRPASSFHPPYGAPHHLGQLSSSANSYAPNMDRYTIANLADRYLRGTDKYSHNQYPLLDQRRMSEPAMRGSAASGYPANTTDPSNPRYHHQPQHRYSYVPPRSYAAHSSSPLHPSSDARPISRSPWKQDLHLPLHPYDPIQLQEPLSPLNPTFSGGESPPPMGMSTAVFDSLHEDYGPSPPGTGTSTSSNAPTTHQQAHTTGGPSSPSNSKQYSFVSLPGNAMKKRPRRRYDEIERLYQCSWPNCTKAYGTLNHLNAHITMQKHGPKRSPNEFKELRKQWRKAKKEEADARALDAARHGSYPRQHPLPHHTRSMSDADQQTHDTRPVFDYAHYHERSAQPTGPLDDFHGPVAHQQDVYPRRSQRFSPFVSPHPQHSGIPYPHPHAPGANTSNIPTDRLPANSTLLTPLPGYEPSSMSGPSFDAYDAYHAYHNDNRPRTGHPSPGNHDRPPSSHIDQGTGHDDDDAP